jgi:MFS family permease
MIMKGHYERIIVACAFLLLFVNVGFNSTSFAVYQSHIVDLPGVGDVGGSVVVTVRTLVAFICMFFTGIFYRRVNPRIGFFIATLFTTIAFILFGCAQSFVGLCVAAFCGGIAYGFGGMVASTYLIGNWFRGKVGSVSGIATMGSGVASIVIPLIAGWLIDSFSLSTAFYAEAGFALVLALLLLAFVRVKPQDVGLTPITHEKESSEIKAPSGALHKKHLHLHFHRVHHSHHAGPFAQPKVSLSSTPLPRGAYLVMIFALVLLGGVSVAGFNYFGILLTTQGIDLGIAAALISLSGVFLTLSKFAVGVVCDKFGTLVGSFIFFVLLVIAMVLCALVGAGGVPEAAAAAVVLGIGMPLGTTGIALWSLELSTPEQMLKTIRHFQLAYAFGGFIFNLMPGVLCALTGTYTSSYFVMLGMTLICAIVVVVVYAQHIKRAQAAVGGDGQAR